MKHFNGFYKNTNIDYNSIPQDLLNISNKCKSNPLPWNGQFSPQLVQVLLHEYANKNDFIFDPFLGSGTVLLESGEYGVKAIGTEINYAAVCLSKIYELINTNLSERIFLLNNLDNQFKETFIFKNSNPIIEIKKILEKTSNEKSKTILRAFIILIDLYKEKFTVKWFEQKWHKIMDIVNSLPVSKKEIFVLNEDARETSILDSSTSFVITSPPYINVFNYHQQYRSSAEFLNGSVLPVAQAEIGSNRKHRSNRLYTVIQYCMDISKVFEEINRVCKNGSHIIFIVGRESSVRKTAFYNGEIISELATRINGLHFISRQERVFTNRFGLRIFEDILHFKSTKQKTEKISEKARKIGLEILESVKKYAPSETIDDINDAIIKAESIVFSPIMKNKLKSFHV